MGASRFLPLLLVACLLAAVGAGCRSERNGEKGKHKDKAEKPEPAPSKPGRKKVKSRWDRYRTGQIDPVVREVPSDIQKGVFRDPDRYIGRLVQFLLDGAKNDYHKVKRLHDWIADNIRYDTKGYFSGKAKHGTFADVLRTGSSVCDGYAGLFQHMCELGGLQCVTVSGYGRGFGHRLFQNEDPSESNHAWNAVKIDNRWHLLDITWDAGHIGDARDYKKTYRTDFLFLAPDEFLHTHFPTDPDWQLMESPLSAQEFVELPYLRGEFFGFGLRLLSDVSGVQEVSDQASLELEVPQEVEIVAHLAAPDDSKREQYVLLRTAADATTLQILFPSKGEWKVRLFARSAGGAPDALYTWVADFGYVASHASRLHFPRVYTLFNTLGSNLEAPLHAPLRSGIPTSFELELPGVANVALAEPGQRSGWFNLQRTPHSNLWTGVYSPKHANGLTVLVQQDPSDTRWSVVLEY